MGRGRGGGAAFARCLRFVCTDVASGKGGGGTGEACHELEDRKREREACRSGWM